MVTVLVFSVVCFATSLAVYLGMNLIEKIGDEMYPSNDKEEEE